MFHQMFTVDFGTSFVLCEHRGKEQHKEIPFVGALLPLLVWRLFRILRGKELTGTEGQGYSVFRGAMQQAGHRASSCLAMSQAWHLTWSLLLTVRSSVR